MPLKLPLSVKESGPVLDCHWPLTLILHGAKLYVDLDLESWHIILLVKLFCQNIGRHLTQGAEQDLSYFQKSYTMCQARFVIF